MTDMPADEVRRRIGVDLSDAEVAELALWYAAQARGRDAFPRAELHGLEPPLRSTPGPRLRPS